jgi:hypothetical protein
MTPAGNQEGFLWSNGSSENLGTLAPGRNSEAFSINNQGDIVGTAEAITGFTFRTNPITGVVTVVTNYQNHAFLYSNGLMIDLNNVISTNSGWELYYAFGVNNSDQILGWGSMDGGDHIRSFILQVPEPSVPTLFILLASALALRTRSFRLKRLLKPITLKQPSQFDAILEIKFLNKKRVGSQFIRPIHIPKLTGGSQHDNRQTSYAILFSNPDEHFEAIHPGKFQVQQDQCR